MLRGISEYAVLISEGWLSIQRLSLSFTRDVLPLPDRRNEMQKPKDKAKPNPHERARCGQAIENDLVDPSQKPEQRDGNRCDLPQASCEQVMPLKDGQVGKDQQGECHVDVQRRYRRADVWG